MIHRNKERQLAAVRDWRKRNKGYHTQYRAKYLAWKPWVRTFYNISSRCTGKDHHYFKNGIKNFLSVKDVEFLWFRDMAYLLKKPSLDRKDNKKHYTIDNCEFMELRDNLEKRYKTGT